MLFCSVNEDEFELDREFEKGGIVYRELRLKNRGTRCLGCGKYHTSVKEYRTRKIRHSLYSNRKCIVIYHQQRFVCPECGKTRMETNPFVFDSNRISDKTVLDILTTLKRYNVPFRQAASMYNVTPREVMNIFDKYVNIPRSSLSAAICFDEVYFSRHRKKKYVLIILNFRNRAILDILKDRDKSTLTGYLRKLDFKEKDAVEYVGIDMNDNYRELANVYFKNALIVADLFHVVKHISDALDSVRKRILGRYSDNKKCDEYYMLKYRSELLFTVDTLTGEMREVKRNHHFHLEISEFEILEKMLLIDRQLKDAYELYHRYIRFNSMNYMDENLCLDELNDIINDYRISGIEEFMKVANTLTNWKKEIANSFVRYQGERISNGPIEGRNSLVKKISKLPMDIQISTDSEIGRCIA